MQEADPMKKTDKGVAALLATGLVPEGATFLTNISDSPVPELGVTKEKVVEKYKKEGYEVTVLEGTAFDVNGNPTDGSAVVGKKVAS